MQIYISHVLHLLCTVTCCESQTLKPVWLIHLKSKACINTSSWNIAHICRSSPAQRSSSAVPGDVFFPLSLSQQVSVLVLSSPSLASAQRPHLRYGEETLFSKVLLLNSCAKKKWCCLTIIQRVRLQLRITLLMFFPCKHVLGELWRHTHSLN